MSDQREWYLPDPGGIEPEGPFTTDELKKRLKAGKLRLDDYVWGAHFEDQRWRRFFEVEDFAPPKKVVPRMAVPRKRSRGRGMTRSIQINYAKDDKNEFRRYPRIPITCEAIVSNQQKYVRGNCVDISEKGVFLRVKDHKAFTQGEEIMVTIRGAKDVGTFSAVSVILRVSENPSNPGYGIYFLRINPQTRRAIARMVLKHFSDKGGEAGAA